MQKKIDEAVGYFKQDHTYDRLFQQFRKKYESLGRIGGTVSMDTLQEENVAILAEFFGMTVTQLKKKQSISLQQFEAQLQETRFEGLNLKVLLDAYFGEVILSKKEVAMQKERALQILIDSLQENYPSIAFWLEHIAKNEGEARWILRLAAKNESLFQEYVTMLNKAYKALPRRPERIPVFSQRITGDPHAFDLHTDLGRMFIHLLTITRSSGELVPRDTEGINDLLADYFIYRDDLLNFVSCANLRAFDNEGVHPVWEAAVERQTIQLVPLRELAKLTFVGPSKGERVWVVENSGVCASLLDYKPTIPIISTNGQATLATLLLLDLIVASGYDIYYAGDFDPEGLGMADRYKERHPNHVYFWRMDGNAYLQTNPMKSLTVERLEKLKRIQDESLQEVGRLMSEKGVAGYQEALLGEMMRDIEEYSGS